MSTFLVLVVTLAPAATQNALIYGTVYDIAGRPMPGVMVILSNPALALTRAATTTADGAYEFTEVPPAHGYRLAASKGARILDSRLDITVNVGDERVMLPPLKEQVAADTSAAAETHIEGPLVNELRSTAVSGVITGQQLRSLPLYNRNFLALGLLTPNTHDVEPGSELAGASFSIAGARPATNNFLIDGTDNVASSSNQAVPFQVNDAIQEFRVISSTASSEYGRNRGGVVNVITQRGTNAVHGSTFGYFASDRLNWDRRLSVYNASGFNEAALYAGSTSANRVADRPRDYNSYVFNAQRGGFCSDGLPTVCRHTRFDPATILAANDSHTQPLDSKQFGLNLGGPLIKQKLFAFASYEGTRIDNPTPIFERVPSAFDKSYDPLRSGIMGFAPNDPNFLFAQRLLALYPAANVVAVPGVLEFYRGEAPNYTNVHNGLMRADYTASNQSSLSMRYVGQALNQLHDATLPKQQTYPGNGALRDALNQNATLSFSHAPTQNLSYEIRAGLNRFSVRESAQDKNFDTSSFGLTTPAMMTLLLSGLDTQYSGATNSARGGEDGAFAGWADPGSIMLPTLDGLFPFARIGAPLTVPGLRRDTTWLGSGSLSWSHGKHATKLGAEFRYLDNRIVNGGFARGYLVSSNVGEFTHDSETCNDTCQTAFLRPSFDYALRQPTAYAGDFDSYAASGFLQDTWRFHPRWTLNAGLRYEYVAVPQEENDRIWNFDPVANGLVRQNATSVVDPFGNLCSGFGTVSNGAQYADQRETSSWRCNPRGNSRIVKNQPNNFAPRVGMAWDIAGNGKTVARVGIGWFYDQPPVNYTSQLMFNRPTPVAPNSPQATYGQNYLSSFCPRLVPGQEPACGLGNASVNPAAIVANRTQAFQSASSPFPIYARDLNNSGTPYSRQISASIQQSVGAKMAVEIGYVGTTGKRLPVVVNSGFLNEWFCTNTPGCDNFSKLPVFTMTNQGNSSYHSLMARIRLAQWGGLQAHATYSFSKALDNASDASFPLIPSTLFNQALAFQFLGNGNPSEACLILGVRGCSRRGVGTGATVVAPTSALTTTGAGQVFVSRYPLPQDPINFLRDDWGRADFDNTHRGVLDYTWQLPSPRPRSRWLGHWQLSGIFEIRSGQPFTVFAGPLFGELTQRVNYTGKVVLSNNPENAISRDVFSLPARQCGFATGAPLFEFAPGSACIGNLRRNAFTGPDYMNLSLALQKAIPLWSENSTLNLRAEVYNPFNRGNLYNPISAFSLDGLSLNPEFGRIKSAHDPRQMQLAARIVW